MSRILYTPGKEKKVKHSRAREIFIVAAGVLVLAILSGGIFIVRRPQWQIRNITIRGLHAISETRVRDRIDHYLTGTYGWVVPHSSVFLVWGRAIADTLQKEFPEIKEITVHKRFPDGLDITIKERVLWAIFCNDLEKSGGSSCVAIDDSGYAYASSPEPVGSLITRVRSDGADVAVGSFMVSRKTMDDLLLLEEKLPETTSAVPTDFELRVHTPSDIRVVVSDGYRIFFRQDADLVNAFRVLKKVLDEEIKDNRKKLDYIDLRFGNKVFYKMK